jgi:hypothetical protein
VIQGDWAGLACQDMVCADGSLDTAKRFAVFPQCKMSLLADTVEKGLALIGEQ